MRIRTITRRFGTAAAFVTAVVTIGVIVATLPSAQLPRPAAAARRRVTLQPWKNPPQLRIIRVRQSSLANASLAFVDTAR